MIQASLIEPHQGGQLALLWDKLVEHLQIRLRLLTFQQFEIWINLEKQTLIQRNLRPLGGVSVCILKLL